MHGYAGAPIQLDANMGWVNAVQEMPQVSPDMVKLLPAPERWRSGRLSDWRFHTGRITVEWDRDAGMFHAKLEAERETNILVSLPPWAGNVAWPARSLHPAINARALLCGSSGPGNTAVDPWRPAGRRGRKRTSKLNWPKTGSSQKHLNYRHEPLVEVLLF